MLRRARGPARSRPGRAPLVARLRVAGPRGPASGRGRARPPRSATPIDTRSTLSCSPRVGSIRRCELRASTTASTGSVPSSGTSTGAPRSHGGPSAPPSPARCAVVTSGNSTGAASTSPTAAGPVASSAGLPSPSATTATGHSCTPSAPTSEATVASGKRLCSKAVRPAEPATASSWESIVPASQ